jgi:hypothetical protein
MNCLKEADLRKTTALITVLALGLMSSPAALSRQIAPAPESAVIDINHDPLACVAPEYAPKVDAAVLPGPEYDRGYVYFRASGTEDYYYAKMDGPAQTLVAVLPRPLPDTRAVDYYLRAYDTRAATKKKGEWTPPVVSGTTCKSKGVSVGPKGAGLTIGLTKEKQTPIPPGFNSKDIARVILVTGAIVSLAEAVKMMGGKPAASSGGGASSGAGTAGAGGAGAAAGGLSTGLLIAGGAVVVAGVAVAASSKGGNNPTATPTSTPAPTVTPTPVIPRFLEAEATWSGVGDIDVQMLGPSGQPVGQTFPAGCEPTSSRTERVILQGSLAAGTYRIVLKGNSCGVGTPATISAVLSVQSESGPKCSNAFVNVPVGGSVEGCQFTLP